MAALIFWGVVGCNHLIKKQRDKRLYKHSNINPARRETRVLTLAPGSFLDDLSGDIHALSLDYGSSARMPYEAVSYVWGSTANKPDFIRIGSSGRRIWLPYNLGRMLRFLRYKDRTRTLWVDYISIYQDDVKEKARQVSMMTEIYESAERVVVWLGPAANESNTAMGLLEDLGSMVEFDFDNQRMRPSPAGAVEPSWADPSEYLPYEQDELWSIYELVHRAWFGRVWSRLEIGAAADPAAALVVCGNKSMSWDIFRTALACIANKPRHYLDLSEESSPELRFARRYELVLLLCQPEKAYGFVDLLDQARKFNCADPRDRIFTALSMAADLHEDFSTMQPPQPLNLSIDYTRSKTQVYRDAVLRYIDHSRNTNVLASCEMTTVSKPNPISMPSWIPDWSVKRTANTMPMHLASSLSEAHVRHNGSDVLRVSGVRCATVKTARELFGDFVPIPAVVEAIRRCAPENTLHDSYKPQAAAAAADQGGQEGMLQAYAATLAWGLSDTLYNPPLEAYPDIGVSVESLRFVLEQQQHEEEEADKRRLQNGGRASTTSTSYDFATLTFITHLLGTCKGRSFFTTEEGYIGLGPRQTRPGDKVFVVLGCDVPLILRHRLDSKSEVVGDAYVHGLMTGEALLGPLPEGWHMVLDSEGEQGDTAEDMTGTRSMFVHVGGASGRSVLERTAEDPRAGALREKVGGGRGEKAPQLALEDLLTPANLRRAGVEVVDANLA